jgi:hypothetical protein
MEQEEKMEQEETKFEIAIPMEAVPMEAETVNTL